MLNIEFEKELGKNYMVLDGRGHSYDYSIRMVCENRVDSLLPVEVSNIDSRTKYYYEIDGLLSLEKYYASSSMEYDDISRIISSIVSLPNRLDEYLLDKDYVFLSPSTVFLDAEGVPHYIYYPDKTLDYSDGIRKICTFILRKMNHQDEKTVSLGYAAFEISSRESFALSDFERAFNIESAVMEGEMVEDDPLELFAGDIDELDFDSIDLFEEDDVIDDDFDDYTDIAPREVEKASKKEKTIEKILKYGPFALIIIIGLFLFLSSSMSTLSLPLRILSFAMISVAIFLLSYLIKGRSAAPKN